jgi:protein-L-isoaspartate(D-aspartate) O-methyltransferase
MTVLNFEPAREQMVYHQIRPWDVLDQRVLDTLARIPRERFVPSRYQQLAFADTEIPLPCGQRMLKPILEGRLLQALGAGNRHHTLVVGTGSGYVTACVAPLSDHVTAIDIHPELTDAAAARLADEKIRNVELQTADFSSLTPTSGFDRILMTGSIPLFDPRIPDWLNDGGQAIVIVGSEPTMTVERIIRSGDHYVREQLLETVVQRLENVSEPEQFIL